MVSCCGIPDAERVDTYIGNYAYKGIIDIDIYIIEGN